MPGWLIVLIVILAIIVGFTILLYFLGKKAEKKQAEQEEQIRAATQQMSMLIIDKKKMHIRDAGLPPAVTQNTPWYASRAKVPIVRAKVGPKVMNFMCDAKIFDEIPLKKEVKASVAGLYITGVRGLHGKIETPVKKKQSLRERLMKKAGEYRDTASKEKKK